MTMQKTIVSTLQRLYSLQLFGIKLGLENISALAEHLGNPQKNFPTIHIAGTNGKGSTASMIAAVLSASGYRVGLYTSPHLTRFNERIRINGKEISDEKLESLAEIILPWCEEHHATFFEATTAMAFKYFSDSKVDIAVIETGLGGRLDATNIITPLVSVITGIGLDHTEHLGTTLQEIAREKAGIIKEGVPVVAMHDSIEAARVIEHTAKEKNTSINFIIKAQRSSYTLDLTGEHQKLNACKALAALEVLKKKFTTPPEAYSYGLAHVRELTGLRGRLEEVSQSPRIIIDVAHNPDAIGAVATYCKKKFSSKPIVVFGVMADKAVNEMAEIILRMSSVILLVEPKTERAMKLEKLIEKFSDRAQVQMGGTVAEGMKLAKRLATPDDVILILGSFYVAGEAIENL